MKRVLVLGCGDKKLHSGSVHLFRGLRQFTNGEFVSATNADIRREVRPDLILDVDRPAWVEIDDESYHIIIAEHIAEHVHERMDFIRECHRILKDDGVLILEVPNWKHADAYAMIEHRSLWARNTFDDNYVTRDEWTKLRVEYRLTLMGKWVWVKNEFIGRQLDKFTRLVSGLRFYLKRA